MNETGIIFQGWGVRGILADLKTMTRRTRGLDKTPKWVEKFSPSDVGGPWWDGHAIGRDQTFRIKCPYGQPRDRLWVRETWSYWGGKKQIKADSALTGLVDGSAIFYRATDVPDPNAPKGFFPGWYPSIHMPRWASRIDLEVLKVRVERLQDISEEDAKAEGAEPGFRLEDGFIGIQNKLDFVGRPYGWGFRRIWLQVNSLQSWNANPWVWVVEFKRVRP